MEHACGLHQCDTSQLVVARYIASSSAYQSNHSGWLLYVRQMVLMSAPDLIGLRWSKDMGALMPRELPTAGFASTATCC